MDTLSPVEAWAREARAKLLNGGLHEADLDELLAATATAKGARRQWVLYLQATTPSIRSQVIGMALHEPIANSITQIGTNAQWPYATVHDALLDGWQIISFPQQRVPFDDREIDVLGYEFILQKMQEVSHG